MAAPKVISRNFRNLLACKSYSANVTVKHSVWTQENIVRSPFKDVEIPRRSLPEHIWENLERWPDKTAMVCGITNRSITYHQLYKYSRNFAAHLRTNFHLTDGDVVCIMMANAPEYAPAVIGALEAGAEVTTINPIYTAHEVHRQLLLSNPKILIGVPESVPILKEALKLAKKTIPIITCNAKNNLPFDTISFEELINDDSVNKEVLKQVRKNFEDVILLPYSSGTTGLPKGVELTTKNIVSNCIQQDMKEIRHYDDTTSSHQESVVAVLPFYHIYGLVIIMLHKLSVGGKVVTLPKFEPTSFLKTFDDHRTSLLYTAPPLVLFLASFPGVTSKHLESVNRIVCGAAPLPKSDIDKVLEKVKHDLKFLQVYGLTETSPLVTTFTQDYQKYTTAGFPISNTELKIIGGKSENLGPNQVGELLIRGPQIMKGYRNNVEATNNCITEDGWFKSGDLASIDEDGSLTIADRLKELIKVKGYQVPPAELESVIKEHPAVLDAGVVGIPDPKTGERPKAFVVLKEGLKAVPKDIETFVSERVAEFKRLKDVTFVDSLPKNPSGKLLRRILKEKHC
ncbi:uncharacterized protein LOC135077808 [Ostrinia nubilalis]|uniref:uncharacterized protein LOC135077808 n=1 Tax=Ostrinia nubilalis TaxID=29057 RepID=UPI003082431B